MSLLLQGPFPLLEAEVVLGDLHDPLYQLLVGDGLVTERLCLSKSGFDDLASEVL